MDGIRRELEWTRDELMRMEQERTGAESEQNGTVMERKTMQVIEIEDYNLDSYKKFLFAKKSAIHKVVGNSIFVEDFAGGSVSDTVELSPFLFDYQKFIVRLCLKKQRFAIFADIGLGKTNCFLEWAKHVSKAIYPKKTLIITQLHLINQTLEEQMRWYGYNNILDINKIFGGSINKFLNINNTKWEGVPIGIVNLDKFREPYRLQDEVGAIVLDECFAPDTPVEIFNPDQSVSSKNIEDVAVGDLILNAQGVDNVVKINKRQIDRAVQIRVWGRDFTCSTNHPFFTLHGWKCAEYLQPGDYILATKTAMRLVWDDFHAERCSYEKAKILRDILLSEMEDEPKSIQIQMPQSRSNNQTCDENKDVVSIRDGIRQKEYRKDSEFESNEQPFYKNESFCHLKSNETQTIYTRGEWEGFDSSSKEPSGDIGGRLGTRICDFFRKEKGGLSDTLQNGFSITDNENSDRSRWFFSSLKEASGSQEGYETELFRVDSVKILEQGCHELDKYRDSNGIVYFYDITAKQHPSFSVNGMLVHNSSALKNETGKIRTNIINACKGIKYKLACTATPAPNDRQEYANHALFLDYIDNFKQFFTKFFFNTGEGNKFQLKPHSRRDFYLFLASWSIFLKNPVKYGFEDNLIGIIPPEVIWEEVLLTKEQEVLIQKYTKKGQINIFKPNIGGLTNRNKVSQISKGFLYHD